MTMMKGWIDDLIGMVFPRVCEVCGQSLVHGEEYLCLDCFVGMPRTGIHRDTFNAVHRRLAGKTPVDRAASMYWYYRQSDYARLIHEAKYRGRPALARWLGHRYAAEIKADGFFDGIDLLLPVPMYFLKRMFRGYNQAEAIALGVSAESGTTLLPGAVMLRRLAKTLTVAILTLAASTECAVLMNFRAGIFLSSMMW